MKIKNIYPYKELKRNDGKVRTYETEGGKKLSSVTSILSETQTVEKKRGLENWKKRVGEKEAEKIKNKQIVEELALPPVKVHCSVLAEDAVKAAIADWRKKKDDKESGNG